MSFRQRSVNVHDFAMVPRADIPRSSFTMQRTLKTTFDAGPLVPIFCEEILPGDTWNLRATLFARLATPLTPVMDNMYLETFFFFVPMRLVWSNFKKFMGEQVNPGDSTNYVIPQLVSPTGGWEPLTIFDYFGLPTEGQVDVAGTVSVNALPLRAYNLIYNEWFRDENLDNSLTVNTGNGPDSNSDYIMQWRAKRHDYFTSCLPWPQKATTPIGIPLSGSATVRTNSTALVSGTQNTMNMLSAAAGTAPGELNVGLSSGGALSYGTGTFGYTGGLYPSNLYADLSTATNATINQLRTAFQLQKLLERDARGGTRYTEIVRAHFGVISPDSRLQRPEYLGGGSTAININPVVQTSEGTGTPQGNLAGMGTALANGHGFSQSFTEHGYVIGLVNVRADLTYQQGLRRMWSRSTKYDFYWPAFAHISEQTVFQKEIYCQGTVDDDIVFGYQERFGEYRYLPSQITGLFKSSTANNIDEWHLAQYFELAPELDDFFIQERPPVSRIVAVQEEADGQQFLLDSFFEIRAARPMPMYSVPGLVDHF